MVAFPESFAEPDWKQGLNFVIYRGVEVVERLLVHDCEDKFREEIRAVRQDCLIPQDYFFKCLGQAVYLLGHGNVEVYLRGAGPVTGLVDVLVDVLKVLAENDFEKHLYSRFNVPENRQKIAEAYYRIEPEKLELIAG